MLNCVLVQLFGWDLKSLWQTANKQRCHALLLDDQAGTAFEAYRYMMDMSDEPTKAIFLDWIPGKSSETLPVLQCSLECPLALNGRRSALHASREDVALATSGYLGISKHEGVGV